MKRKIKEKLFELICAFIERQTNYPLQYFAQLRAEKLFFQTPPEEIENILGNEKIVVVDVGARGGLEEGLIRYLSLLNIILCEADPEEATRLKTLGYARVFDCIVGHDESDQRTLSVGTHPGTSSCFEVESDYLDFYCSGSTERFNPAREVTRPSASLASLLNNTVNNIDYLKIDTQGSELEVLKGLGRFRPIIIKCEVSYIPLYKNSALIFDIQKFLYDLGYVMFHISSVMRSAPSKHRSARPFDETVIPLHGDAYFMPDWARWHLVVGDREKKFSALMNMFGLRSVFEYSKK